MIGDSTALVMTQASLAAPPKNCFSHDPAQLPAPPSLPPSAPTPLRVCFWLLSASPALQSIPHSALQRESLSSALTDTSPKPIYLVRMPSKVFLNQSWASFLVTLWGAPILLLACFLRATRPPLLARLT